MIGAMRLRAPFVLVFVFLAATVAGARTAPSLGATERRIAEAVSEHAAPYADALGGLGPEGEGAHSPQESVELPTVIESAQRAALLLHRLARTPEGAAEADRAEAAVIFLVRHAEKIDPYPDGPSDPPLTEAGRARAAELARTLADAGIERVLTTDFRRTRDTAAPLAEALGLEPEPYDPAALEELAGRLAATGERVLVVGHSNTTPRLVELLGGDPGPPIAEPSEYDRLYVLSLPVGDDPITTRMRYGEASPTGGDPDGSSDGDPQ